MMDASSRATATLVGATVPKTPPRLRDDPPPTTDRTPESASSRRSRASRALLDSELAAVRDDADASPASARGGIARKLFSAQFTGGEISAASPASRQGTAAPSSSSPARPSAATPAAASQDIRALLVRVTASAVQHRCSCSLASSHCSQIALTRMRAGAESEERDVLHMACAALEELEQTRASHALTLQGA
jgi:hypothetical protein